MSEQEKMAANMLIRARIESLNERLGENGVKIIFWKVGLTHLFDTPLKNDLEPCITVNEQAKMFIEVINVIGLVGALGI